MSYPEPRFEFSEQEPDERTLVIAVAGEIHVSSAPEFSRRMGQAIARGKPAVVLDLTHVGFIDSTGLSVLLAGLRQVTQQDGRMAVVSSNPTVLRLFEITRLDTTLDIHPGLDGALAAARRPQEPPDSSAGAP